MRIRLWKLGSLEHRIMPGPQAFQKLKDILQEASTSGRETFDLIWDPALSVQEIEVGPDGIDVPVGDVAFSDELRGKIEQLIADHMRPSLDPMLEKGQEVIDRLVSVFMTDIRTKADRVKVDFSRVEAVKVFYDDMLHRSGRYGWYGWLDWDGHSVASSVDIPIRNFPKQGVLLPLVTQRLRDAMGEFVREQKALQSQSGPVGQVVRQKPADLRTVAETVSEADNPVVSLKGSSVLGDVHADIAKRVMASVRCRWDGHRGKSDVLLEPTMESTASEFAVSERVMKYSFDLSDSAKAALADYVSIGEPGLFTPGPKKCDCPAENFAANGIGCVCGGV